MAAVICTNCGVEVDSLALFPGNICLECHAVKHENDTSEELYRDIMRGFGAK